MVNKFACFRSDMGEVVSGEICEWLKGLGLTITPEIADEVCAASTMKFVVFMSKDWFKKFSTITYKLNLPENGIVCNVQHDFEEDDEIVCYATERVWRDTIAALSKGFPTKHLNEISKRLHTSLAYQLYPSSGSNARIKEWFNISDREAVVNHATVTLVVHAEQRLQASILPVVDYRGMYRLDANTFVAQVNVLALADWAMMHKDDKKMIKFMQLENFCSKEYTSRTEMFSELLKSFYIDYDLDGSVGDYVTTSGFYGGAHSLYLRSDCGVRTSTSICNWLASLGFSFGDTDGTVNTGVVEDISTVKFVRFDSVDEYAKFRRHTECNGIWGFKVLRTPDDSIVCDGGVICYATLKTWNRILGELRSCCWAVTERWVEYIDEQLFCRDAKKKYVSQWSELSDHDAIVHCMTITFSASVDREYGNLFEHLVHRRGVRENTYDLGSGTFIIQIRVLELIEFFRSNKESKDLMDFTGLKEFCDKQYQSDKDMFNDFLKTVCIDFETM